MSNKIEATYYCAYHGFFTMNMISVNPPQNIVCPTCMRPSELRNFTVGGEIAPSQLDEMNKVLSKLRDTMMGTKVPITPIPRTAGAGAGGGSQEAESTPADIPITPAVKQSIMILHEVKERAKMDAMISAWE